MKLKTRKTKEIKSYEKFTKWLFILDKWTSVILTMVLLSVGFFILFLSLQILSGKAMTLEQTIILLFLFLIAVFSLAITLILMISTIVIKWVLRRYENEKIVIFYIKRYLETHDVKLIKYVLYNIRKIENKIILPVGFTIYKEEAEDFKKFKNRYDDAVINSLNRLITLISDFLIYQTREETDKLLKKCLDVFEKKNYKGIIKICQENQEIFNKIKGYKKEYEKSGFFNKVGICWDFFKNNSKEISALITAVAIIIGAIISQFL